MAKRTFAAESRAHLHLGMPKNADQLKRSIWLSDPGAYPVMIVVTFACTMCCGFMGYHTYNSPDVRITPGRRQVLLRTWEEGQ